MDPVHGGPSQGIRNSIPEHSGMGIVSEVVCLDSPSAAFLGKDPFKVHAIGQASGPWAYSKALLPWLLLHLQEFDVVIVHGLWQYHGFAVRKAFSTIRQKTPLAKLPRLYVMPHGMLDPYFQKADGRKLKAARNWIYWKLIERKLIEAADGVLFTTEEELSLARTTFSPYKPKSEINISYGVKAAPANNESMRLAFLEKCGNVAGNNYLLFLSRLHEKKGVDILIQAYKILQEEGMTLPKLVIAGPGLDTPFGQSLTTMAAANKDIHFPGMLTGDAKWGAFYGCEAFILPSHQENFGIAVVEALSCGKPVLITKQVNIWREITNSNAGLVADDTLEGTVGLLRNWLALDAEMRKQMNDNAFNSFNKKFSIEEAAAKMAGELRLINNMKEERSDA